MTELLVTPRSLTYLMATLCLPEFEVRDLLYLAGATEQDGLWHPAQPFPEVKREAVVMQVAQPENILADALTESHNLRMQNNKLRAQNRALCDKVSQLENYVGATRVNEPVGNFGTLELSGNKPGAALALWSDWHWGENVPGRFSPEVARKRTVRLLGLMEKEWLKMRLSHDVNTLCLGLLGDFITGAIHDENRELGGNHLTATQEQFQVQQALRWGISIILKHFQGLQKLEVYCVHGNHGRMTKHSRGASGHLYSLETLMYWNIAEAFAREPRVNVKVADAPQVYSQVFGKTLRWCHGDFAKAVDPAGLHRWLGKQNKNVRPADYTFMGHVHHLYCADGLVTNGSLVGPTIYGESLGYGEEAGQMMLLLDTKGIQQVSYLRLGE